MLPTTLEGLDDSGVCVYIDEAGRGCFAGPVCAAAVVWPREYTPTNEAEQKLLGMIKDSKKVTEKNRPILAEFIKKHAIKYAVGSVDAKDIDKMNILQATFKAMHIAITELNLPEINHIFVDGNKFKTYIGRDQEYVPHTCIIGGDNKLLQIAAASILAKTHRDAYMTHLGNSTSEFAVYNWAKNKAYGTKEHRDAIKTHGMTQYHRKTFIHF
jgi:ribonuclease HII